MYTSLIVSAIFAIVIILGIIGAFWGRLRRRKLAVREELMESRGELEHLPPLLISGKYPELDGINGLMKNEKVDSLEKITEDLMSRLKEDQCRFRELKNRKTELEKLVMKLDSMNEDTVDLNKILEILRKEGIR